MLEREITLQAGDTTYTLSPTLAALKRIARRWPRVMDSLEDLQRLSLDACATIVSAATGYSQERAEEIVFQAGLNASATACAEFVLFLINPADSEASEKK